MSIKQKIAIPFAKRVKKKLLLKSHQAEDTQLGVLTYLLRKGEFVKHLAPPQGLSTFR